MAKTQEAQAVLEANAAAKQGVTAEVLVSLRTDMLRFAELQLRNRETAEDIVQEALEAALRHLSSFAGNSTLKTWVFAILRNRIIDHLRQASRTVNMSSLVEDGEDWEQRMDALFNEQGRWRDDARPAAWPTPEEAMHSQQFWNVFESCLSVLPPQARRVFMMREFLGLDADEICSQLGISISNCHVILHRARMKLRTCMDNGWRPSAVRSC